MKEKHIIATGAGIIILLFFFVMNLNSFFPIAPSDYTPPETQEVQGNGTVLVEEFSDFGCPFCQSAVPTVKRVLENYEGEIVFEYRHFPITQLHPNAQKAAEASECARDQNSFWPYHDILFENQGDHGTESLINYAAAIGLDVETFRQCLMSGEKEDLVMRDFAEGRSRGIQGTPTFFIDGKPYVGVLSYNDFKEAIEDAQS